MEISVGFFFCPKICLLRFVNNVKKNRLFCIETWGFDTFFHYNEAFILLCWVLALQLHFIWLLWTKEFAFGEKKILPNIFAKDFFTAFHKAFHPQFCISMIARWLDNLKQNVNENIKHMFHTHPVYLIAFLPKQEKKKPRTHAVSGEKKKNDTYKNK